MSQEEVCLSPSSSFSQWNGATCGRELLYKPRGGFQPVATGPLGLVMPPAVTDLPGACSWPSQPVRRPFLPAPTAGPVAQALAPTCAHAHAVLLPSPVSQSAPTHWSQQPARPGLIMTSTSTYEFLPGISQGTSVCLLNPNPRKKFLNTLK